VPRIVLDTDVASLGYKGRLPAPLAARLAGNEICVTFVTVGELGPLGREASLGNPRPD